MVRRTASPTTESMAAQPSVGLNVGMRARQAAMSPKTDDAADATEDAADATEDAGEGGGVDGDGGVSSAELVAETSAIGGGDPADNAKGFNFRR